MMCLISRLFLLLLASTCIFCRHVDVFAENNYGIYGGNPIDIAEVPFMALYRGRTVNFTWMCGAAIVDEQFLVTAGHCDIFGKYYIFKNKSFNVTVGTDKAESGGKTFEIEKVIRHPKFHMDDNGIKNDIAVIKLKQKLVFNEKINKISMANSSMILNDGDMMQAIGFGETETKLPSNQLLSVTLPFVNRKTCKKDYKNFGWHVREEMICAGGENGKGSCHGDSGSPLFHKGYLYGVTSWGKPCAIKGYPSVYTSIPFMKDFVEDVIRKNR